MTPYTGGHEFPTFEYTYPQAITIPKLIDHARRVHTGDFGEWRKRAPADPADLDNWAVCALMGFGILEYADKQSGASRLQLTPVGRKLVRLAGDTVYTQNRPGELREFMSEENPALYEHLFAILANFEAVRQLMHFFFIHEQRLEMTPSADVESRNGLFRPFARAYEPGIEGASIKRVTVLTQLAEFCGLLEGYGTGLRRAVCLPLCPEFFGVGEDSGAPQLTQAVKDYFAYRGSGGREDAEAVGFPKEVVDRLRGLFGEQFLRPGYGVSSWCDIPNVEVSGEDAESVEDVEKRERAEESAQTRAILHLSHAQVARRLAWIEAEAQSLPAERFRTTVNRPVRNGQFAALVKRLRGRLCEVCARPTFEDQQGEAYCEVHHLIPKSKDGRDLRSNVLVVCPLCHAAFEHGSEQVRVRLLKDLRSNGFVLDWQQLLDAGVISEGMRDSLCSMDD